eukprot:638645-Amphidinium_carterae.1
MQLQCQKAKLAHGRRSFLVQCFQMNPCTCWRWLEDVEFTVELDPGTFDQAQLKSSAKHKNPFQHDLILMLALSQDSKQSCSPLLGSSSDF